MKKVTKLEMIVAPQDLLMEELKDLKGGRKPRKQKNKCKDGYVININ
jgi:hypothetical protein